MTSFEVFDVMGDDHFEQVAYCQDPPSGLRAIIAIHSTALGPALGGTRFRPYSTERDALVDVCRLARGMTLKHAAAGIDRGGGKAVIIGDPAELRSEALLRAYARFVEGLSGRYLTAEDVGTTQADMDMIRRETRHVTGISPSLGGSGDPSPATAHGVVAAMRAAVTHKWGQDDLAGRHVCVSGVGKVGSALVDELVAVGAEVTVADVDPEAVRRVVDRHGVATVPADEAHRVSCDVFSPCALGGVLNERTIPELDCTLVVGSANNQLEHATDGKLLSDHGVLYVPDFVASAGGVINIAEESDGYDRDRAWRRVEGIADTVRMMLERADRDRGTTHEAAEALAFERIETVARVHRIRTTR